MGRRFKTDGGNLICFAVLSKRKVYLYELTLIYC